MSTIRFENVSKQFANATRPAVDDVSFVVDEGSFVVLLGPSGCGKTTLLKMINRLYEPSAGTIYLGDEDVRQMDATQLRRQIGYVIQQIGLFPHMTVAENIAIVPQLLHWEAGRIAARIDELMTLVDLPPDEYRDRYPSQMSGGQRQRVGVARALAGDPGVILMDEPFGAIDAITRTGLQDELLSLQRKLHKTIVFVTHDVEEALRLADKIVIMRDGRIVQYDSPFTILSRPANQFVRDLIGADDIVRQLSLIRVETAMAPLPADYGRNGYPTIACDDNLRQALSVLLGTAAAALTVLDAEEPVGLLTLADIQNSAVET
ncbi:MAG: ABC transporter ATP-binding protein [Ardenticatenaceae bacterium]|nr:ABC transporter ATP-binding protein [Ardenticatenaceae bacterium]MCB8988005.1 ABC transporter ATP-binding protein [Ardenticatenaceae bacterium]